MAPQQVSPLLCSLLLTLTCLLFRSRCAALGADLKPYIVYMGDLPEDESSATSLHVNMLQKVVGSEAENRLLHSYSKSFNGFSAKLTEEEMEELSDMDGMVSVFQSQKQKLHTTRSWDYMNFPLQVKRSKLESDVIVGVIDSGIWPESESFSDEGLGPPPSKWKGICQSFSNFTCNKKIIGARYSHKEGPIPKKDIPSPRDSDGHGTHTASTAAGNIVSKASLFGLGLGTARGGVPSARIAVYKACWSHGCPDTDLLAAFEDAITDGVDIISISVGSNFATDYFSNSIAIGSFHAMKKGIVTSAAAGNEGPHRQTIANVAPWLLSVASGTTDRKFLTPVKLGNREVYMGFSLNTFELNHTYPLVYAGDAPNKIKGFKGSISRFCAHNSLDKTLTKGKIILCDFSKETSVDTIPSSGVVGYVLRYQGSNETASSFPIPAALMQPEQSAHMFDYTRSTRNPTGVIMKSIKRKEPLAPIIAKSSSRGPNPISPSILKPDITAPGVDILAAYSLLAPVSVFRGDTRRVPFNIISGTSMACPHVSGAAAYVKSIHPDWSAAAIQSAIITSAHPMSSQTNPDGEFAYGAGFLNPLGAAHPGLVYDATETDYVKFLCAEGYSVKQLRQLTKDQSGCSKSSRKNGSDLNYPSFTISSLRQKAFIHIFERTVTNVGSPHSTYKATIHTPKSAKLEILVEPETLKFKSIGEKLTFQLLVVGVVGQNDEALLSASLVWDDGVHQVRSPIVIHVPF